LVWDFGVFLIVDGGEIGWILIGESWDFFSECFLGNYSIDYLSLMRTKELPLLVFLDECTTVELSGCYYY
jgi:hypothetical protein